MESKVNSALRFGSAENKVRQLNSNQSKEHGNEFLTDPGLVYYSPRLATERLETVEVAKQLSEKLGRKISVCDPYAGVGQL